MLPLRAFGPLGVSRGAAPPDVRCGPSGPSLTRISAALWPSGRRLLLYAGGSTSGSPLAKSLLTAWPPPSASVCGRGCGDRYGVATPYIRDLPWRPAMRSVAAAAVASSAVVLGSGTAVAMTQLPKPALLFVGNVPSNVVSSVTVQALLAPFELW